jgi:hypothetical protein
MDNAAELAGGLCSWVGMRASAGPRNPSDGVARSILPRAAELALHRWRAGWRSHQLVLQQGRNLVMAR